MIRSVSEYRHVTGEGVDAAHPHGDLDRILIDGNVMPIRKAPYSVRGEDLAFVMESYLERWKLRGSSFSDTFSRLIRYSKVHDLARGIRHFQTLGEWVKDGYAFGIREAAGNSFGNTYPDAKVDDLESDENDVGTGLASLPIERMFSDLLKLRRTYVMETFSVSRQTCSIIEFVDDESEEYGTHWDPPAWSHCDYEYHMVMMGTPALYKQPWGSVLYKGTGVYVDAGINDCSKSVQAIGLFYVRYNAVRESAGVYENYSKYVFAPVKASAGRSVSFSSDDIYLTCQQCMSFLGISKWQYPGRSQDGVISQDIEVTLVGLYTVREIDDRLRWW